MSRAPLISVAAAVLLASGCLASGPDANSQTFDFNFTTASLDQAWDLGAADYPVAREAEVAVVGDLRPLPTALGTPGNAHFQSGNNVSGDLFIFQKAYRNGLSPLTTYKISLQVSYVTNYHSGCTTGPGPHVVIKAGVSPVDPMALPDAQGVYRMTIDKGVGTDNGDFLQLGDIRNGLSGCPASGTYALRTTSLSRQPLTVTTDGQGGFFLFFGTQSSFAGVHEIYITNLRLRLNL